MLLPVVSDKQKLDELADIEGMEVQEMLERAVTDSVVPAICMTFACDYVEQMEPDQDQGWCDVCEKNTVKSCLILAGLI